MSGTIPHEVYRHYLASLLSGRRAECTGIVTGLIENHVPARRLHLDLFQASMYEVGELWAANRLSVATEHLTAAITEGLLNLVVLKVPLKPRSGRRAVVAGIQPELHQIGAKIVADTIEIRGWDCLYVGANTPAGELLQLCHQTKPNLVALSLTMHPYQTELRGAIDELRREFPAQQIIVGGQGLSTGAPWPSNRYPEVAHLRSLNELDAFLDRFSLDDECRGPHASTDTI